MKGTTDYFSLEKQIRENRLKTLVYLFFGPEQYLIREAVRLLTDHCLSPGSKDFNFLKLDARETNVRQLENELNALPIFSDFRVVVIENSEKYFTSGKHRSQEEEDALLRYLDNPNESCSVIFTMSGKPDSRKKIFKSLCSSGQAVEFPLLKDGQLTKWVRTRLEQMGKKIHGEALNYLIACTGRDLSALEQEMEKLTLYCPDSGEISLDMVRMTISKTAGAGIFDLVDAVGERKVTYAVDLLREMLVAGEAPVYILYMLARQYRLMLSVKSLKKEGLPDNKIQSLLSLHPYVFRKVTRQGKNFREHDLREGLRYLLETDIGLKNSYADSGYLLEMAILKISNL